MKVVVYLKTGAIVDIPVKTRAEARKLAEQIAQKGLLVPGAAGRDTYVMTHQIGGILIEPEGGK